MGFRMDLAELEAETVSLNNHFDQIILINLARRGDRMEQAQKEADKHGFTFTRFEAHDMPGWGNNGCTASHRGVLELISHHKWQKTLVLEDDFKIVHEDFNDRFAAMITQVPEWDMLYLGGHYAEPPQGRVSPNVIRMGHMKTTSSYGITYEQARKMAPAIAGIGPIDELYSNYNRNDRCYIFQPRLMVQSEGYSDLQCHVMNNGGCMMDTAHESMV